ncbi:MAG TPA: hypothetical protein VF411_09035, partial [Bacteroidia bacterium]
PTQINMAYLWERNTSMKLVKEVHERTNYPEKKNSNTELKKKSEKNNTYSHKQIAIAHVVMNITITKENAASILKKYSILKSIDKLIQKRITKTSELTKLSENKTTDTKHLKDLQAAERLVCGTKNKNAKADIKRIIAAFRTSYNNKY